MQQRLDGGMLDLRHADRLVQRFRQQAIDRLGRLQLGRIDADHLAEIGDAGLQVGLRRERIGLGLGQIGFRLRHIGAGDLADLETVPRLAQLLFQHRDIIFVEAEDRGIAQHVHVIRRAVRQHRLLGVAHGFACSQNLGFRLGDRIGNAVAVPQRFRNADAVATRLRKRIGEGCRRMRLAVQIGQAGVGGCGDARAVAGGGARNILIRRTHCRPLGVQVRIAGIGARQRTRNCFGL